MSSRAIHTRAWIRARIARLYLHANVKTAVARRIFARQEKRKNGREIEKKRLFDPVAR